jgi:hypothetical protein
MRADLNKLSGDCMRCQLGFEVEEYCQLNGERDIVMTEYVFELESAYLNTRTDRRQRLLNQRDDREKPRPFQSMETTKPHNRDNMIVCCKVNPDGSTYLS